MTDDRKAETLLRRQARRNEEKVKVQLLAGLSGRGKYMEIVDVPISTAFAYVDHDPPWARWPEGTKPPKRPSRNIDRRLLPPRATEVVSVFDPNMDPVDE
jgi:hypothetical protein